MVRTKRLVGILLIFILAPSIIVITQSNPAFALEPFKLKIYVGPTSVSADNSVYECIFVQLQDSSSKPARALEDTIISLSSSLTSVGSVDPTVTIATGETFAVAKFDSTFTPGATTIAATASGFATVQATIVTVAPVPSKLALYGFPPVLPADGIAYEALVVQLQDSGGNPAKAPLGGLTVTLFSSDDSKATVAASATISGGQTHSLTNITGLSAGTTTITGMASGYASAQASITIQIPMINQPESLRIYSAPPKIMADNTEHPQIAVQLLDAAGRITQQPSASTPIQLSSSNENVGNIESVIDIPAGRVFAIALFSTTYRAGSTTITAATTGLQTDTETITAIGPIPSKLTVYCNPSAVPADNKAYIAIQVQLQDSSGKPALDPNGEVTVSLFSSEPSAGTVQATLTIPYGSTYAMALFTSTYLTSATSITAQASGYTTGQAQMKTYKIDQTSLNVAVTADPASVVSSSQTEIIAYVTDPAQNPVAGATVKFTSSSGGTFTTVKMLENGYYTTTFTAPALKTQTNVTVTATVTLADFAPVIAIEQVIVAPKLLSGIMQICIKDSDNQEPVSNAVVSILPQAAGIVNLTATTNSTGYAVFNNCAEGNYTLSINKQGYFPMNTTFNFKATSSPKILLLTSIDSGQTSSEQTMIWLIPLVAVCAIVVIAVVLRQRRSTHAKI